jgi:hypothetical protein
MTTEAIERLAAQWRPHTIHLSQGEDWNVEAQTFMDQTGYPGFIMSVERLVWADDPNVVCYRFGYYKVLDDERVVWARAAPMIPARDLQPLLAKAHAEGTLLPYGA